MRVLQLKSNHVDARLNLCNVLFAQKYEAAAEKCYKDVLAVNPNYVRGIVNLASYYDYIANADAEADGATSEVAKAIELYQKALKLDPKNAMAKHALAALVVDTDTGAGSTSSKTKEMDSEYVRDLFDSYSFHFDVSLLVDLQYKSHLLVANSIASYYRDISHIIPSCDSDSPAPRILDLGAGTGLACSPIRDTLTALCDGDTDTDTDIPIPATIIGVDISSKMLDRARSKTCYDLLVEGEIVSYLASQATQTHFDIVVSSDVVNYFGDVHPLLTSVAAVLRRPASSESEGGANRGGLFVFTVEDLDKTHSRPLHTSKEKEDKDRDSSADKQEQSCPGEQGTCDATSSLYRLQRSGRFAHSEGYIRQAVAETEVEGGRTGALTVQSITPEVLRYDKSRPVHGLLVVLERTQAIGHRK